jgi:hypothetical protein
LPIFNQYPGQRLAEEAFNLMPVQLKEFMEGTVFFTVPQFFNLPA